jgi:uracil phosphoribosyltransferase
MAVKLPVIQQKLRLLREIREKESQFVNFLQQSTSIITQFNQRLYRPNNRLFSYITEKAKKKA